MPLNPAGSSGSGAGRRINIVKNQPHRPKTGELDYILFKFLVN